MLRPAGEEETAEELLRFGSLQARGALDALEDGAAQVELELLLREVRRYDTVTQAHGSTLRVSLLEDGLQQRRLPRAVRSDEGDVLAALDREARVPEEHAAADRNLEPVCLDDRPTASGGLQELEAELLALASQQADVALRLRALLLEPLDLRQLDLRLARHLLGRGAEPGDETLEPLDVAADPVGRL